MFGCPCLEQCLNFLEKAKRLGRLFGLACFFWTRLFEGMVRDGRKTERKKQTTDAVDCVGV